MAKTVHIDNIDKLLFNPTYYSTELFPVIINNNYCSINKITKFSLFHNPLFVI